MDRVREIERGIYTQRERKRNRERERERCEREIECVKERQSIVKYHMVSERSGDTMSNMSIALP